MQNQNDIQIDRIKSALADIGQTIREACKPYIEALQTLFGSLEPYQRYEIMHPKKKPRGSIRRTKRR